MCVCVGLVRSVGVYVCVCGGVGVCVCVCACVCVNVSEEVGYKDMFSFVIICTTDFLF